MVNNKLLKIITDKTSGSLKILVELHEHLKKERKTIQLFPEIIDIALKRLSSFRAIQFYLDEMKSTLAKEKTLDNFFNKYDDKFRDPFANIFAKSKKLLRRCNRIITISNSKTVFEILVRLKKINSRLEVVVCESRPKFEGRILAKKLTQKNIPVELITEAMVYDGVQKCDAALIGTDTIHKNGDIVNKVGSSLIALTCKYLKKPLYVVATKSKIASTNKFVPKEMPPEEIWRHHNKHLKVNNFYFEKVDRKLITKIIFD